MPEPYSPPVDRLLVLGEGPARAHPWPDYLELGFREEHVPELVRMATDDALLWADSDSLEVWAPVHAWRALGQLRSEEAVQPMVDLLPEMEDSDWALEELPVVFGMIGPPAVTALSTYLADSANELWTRIIAAHGLKKIARADPAVREEVVAALVRSLEKWYRNDETLNAFLVDYLVELRAVEAAPLMERAFAEDRVDPMVRGDWEDVQVDLGLLPERRTPRARLRLAPGFGRRDAPPPASGSRGGSTSKAKKKRRMARQSRKRNRRRK